MLAGVQLSDGLKLEAIADGGFSYAEIPYEIIEKNELPTYKKKAVSYTHLTLPTTSRV